MPYHWTDEQVEQTLNEGRAIADTGQLSPTQRARLKRRADRGELAYWRGHWNCPFGGWGLGPLKSCFARRDVAVAHGVIAA